MWGLYSWSLGRVVAVHTPPRAADAARTVNEPEKLPGLSGSFLRGQQSSNNQIKSDHPSYHFAA